MKFIHRAIALTIIISIVTILSCSPGKNSSKNMELKILNDTAQSVKFRGYSGETIEIQKSPKRVVILLNSLLDLWYFAGGEAIARVSGKINIPAAAKNIEIIGTMGNPNLEKIISLKPDLVIVSREITKQKNICQFLKSGGIPFIELTYRNYNDFLFISELFMKINDKPERMKKILNIKNRVDSIISRCPKNDNSLSMITYATANCITTERPNGDTGTILKMLKGNNIVKESSDKKSTKANISIEKITALNPDIMLIKMMGNNDKVQTKINEYFKNNSCLNEIKAVKQNKLFYLPRKLFMFKPNTRYPEAFEYLAKILYPEIFKGMKK